MDFLRTSQSQLILSYVSKDPGFSIPKLQVVYCTIALIFAFLFSAYENVYFVQEIRLKAPRVLGFTLSINECP